MEFLQWSNFRLSSPRQDAKTLNRFVMASTHDHDMVILMNAIGTSCKLITSAVQRAGVAKLYGLAGEVNSTGDDQKKLDVLSNDMMINALVNSGVCCVLVSEENEEPIIVPPGKAGKFCEYASHSFGSRVESWLNFLILRFLFRRGFRPLGWI